MIDSFLVFGQWADTDAWPETAYVGILSPGMDIDAFVHLPLAGMVLRIALPGSAASAPRRKVNA
jgi:hypothetical protein